MDANQQVVIRHTFQSLFVICRRHTAWRRRNVSVVASTVTTITVSSTNVCFKEDELLFCYRPGIITGCVIHVAGDDAVQWLIREEVRRNICTIKLRGIRSSNLFQQKFYVTLELWFHVLVSVGINTGIPSCNVSFHNVHKSSHFNLLGSWLLSTWLLTHELELQFNLPLNTCGKLIENNASRETAPK
jgi:hypothetical protein